MFNWNSVTEQKIIWVFVLSHKCNSKSTSNTNFLMFLHLSDICGHLNVVYPHFNWYILIKNATKFFTGYLSCKTLGLSCHSPNHIVPYSMLGLNIFWYLKLCIYYEFLNAFWSFTNQCSKFLCINKFYKNFQCCLNEIILLLIYISVNYYDIISKWNFKHILYFN